MSRFSHADPRYNAALDEMARNLRGLMNDRDMTQADLVRAAQPHMPIDPKTQKPGRVGADNISNAVNGKRRPMRSTIKALCGVFNVTEDAFMPPYLMDLRSPQADAAPLLKEVVGEPGLYHVVIDRKLPLAEALRLIAALEARDA